MPAAVIESLERRALLAGGPPAPDHVVVVILENHAYGQIVGNASAPYLNQLGQGGAVFTNSFGVARPSQPNYLGLFSGSTQGVTSDAVPQNFGNVANLGSQLFASGREFAGYAEDLPGVGYTGNSSGRYDRKHNPWVDFSNIPASANQPLTSFPSDYSRLPTVSFVVPNEDDNMHDGSVAAGDAWVQNHLGGYADWATTHNSLLVVTFDESNGGDATNHIATIFSGANVKPGQYGESIDHYRLLRTIEAMYGLPGLGNAAGATPITDVWTSSTGGVDTTAPAATLTSAPRLRTLHLKYYLFSVTYADDVAVVPGSMDGSDVAVTGPGGYARAAQLVSVNRYRSGPVRTATYQVKAPDGSRWARSDNGRYTITLHANQVRDTGGNFAAAGVLGQFSVAIPRTVVAAALVAPPSLERSVFSTTVPDELLV